MVSKMSWDNDLCTENMCGRLLGSSKGPLILFDVVEWQMPDRYVRKFGYEKDIPDNAFDHRAIRKNDQFEQEDGWTTRREY